MLWPVALNVFGACTIAPDLSGHVTVPAGTTALASQAFSDCGPGTSTNKLKTISFPASLTSLGSQVFRYQDELLSLDFSGTGITSFGYQICATCSQLHTLRLPATVTSIGSMACEYCSALTQVDIGSLTALTEIKMKAFRQATNLNDVGSPFPSSLQSIEHSVFTSAAIGWVQIDPTCWVGGSAFPNGYGTVAPSPPPTPPTPPSSPPQLPPPLLPPPRLPPPLLPPVVSEANASTNATAAPPAVCSSRACSFQARTLEEQVTAATTARVTSAAATTVAIAAAAAMGAPAALPLALVLQRAVLFTNIGGAPANPALASVGEQMQWTQGRFGLFSMARSGSSSSGSDEGSSSESYDGGNGGNRRRTSASGGSGGSAGSAAGQSGGGGASAGGGGSSSRRSQALAVRDALLVSVSDFAAIFFVFFILHLGVLWRWRKCMSRPTPPPGGVAPKPLRGTRAVDTAAVVLAPRGRGTAQAAQADEWAGAPPKRQPSDGGFHLFGWLQPKAQALEKAVAEGAPQRVKDASTEPQGRRRYRTKLRLRRVLLEWAVAPTSPANPTAAAAQTTT